MGAFRFVLSASGHHVIYMSDQTSCIKWSSKSNHIIVNVIFKFFVQR